MKRYFDRDLKKEEEYIHEFARLFHEKFKYLVEKAVENKKDFTNQNDLIQEVIQHASHCRKLTSKMPEFHKMYSSLEEYVNNDQNTCPFVLTGPSGAGKSSLMAFVAKKVIHMNFKMYLTIVPTILLIKGIQLIQLLSSVLLAHHNCLQLLIQYLHQFSNYWNSFLKLIFKMKNIKKQDAFEIN